jgi:hypothetical protein
MMIAQHYTGAISVQFLLGHKRYDWSGIFSKLLSGKVSLWIRLWCEMTCYSNILLSFLENLDTNEYINASTIHMMYEANIHIYRMYSRQTSSSLFPSRKKMTKWRGSVPMSLDLCPFAKESKVKFKNHLKWAHRHKGKVIWLHLLVFAFGRPQSCPPKA